MIDLRIITEAVREAVTSQNCPKCGNVWSGLQTECCPGCKQSIAEDAPAMAAGHGAVAGIGVGPQGEPGIDVRKLRKKTGLSETIRKVKGGYRLVSKSGKNLGTYPSKAGAKKREKQVQFFKHQHEETEPYPSISKDDLAYEPCHQCRGVGYTGYENQEPCSACSACHGLGGHFINRSGRQAYRPDQVRESVMSFMDFRQPLIECIAISKEIDGDVILAKNRDRKYHPTLAVVQELIDGTEVAYLLDEDTDWSEGLNEYGIGIINTALMVNYDENEKKIIKNGAQPSEDGERIRYALSKKTLKDALKAVVKYNGGVKGHTIVASPEAVYTVEMTSQHPPWVEKHNPKDIVVRTNHGMHYAHAGYNQDTSPDNYKSSVIRKRDAEKAMKHIHTWEDVLPLIFQQPYEPDSNYNMRRDTPDMSTTSQIVLNLTKRILELNYIDGKVNEFDEVQNKLPENHDPKIKVKVKKVGSGPSEK